MSLDKIKIKINQNLINKNIILKQKIRDLETKNQDLIKEKQELYNLIDRQQAEFREADIKQRKIKELLKKSELFNKLLEVLEQ